MFVAEQTGNETLVSFTCGGQQLTARAAGEQRYDFDETLWFSFAASPLHLFEAGTGRALQ